MNPTRKIAGVDIELTPCEHCQIDPTPEEADLALSRYLGSQEKCVLCQKGFRIWSATLDHKAEKRGEALQWRLSPILSEDAVILTCNGVVESQEVSGCAAVHPECMNKKIPDLLKARDGHPVAPEVPPPAEEKPDPERFWSKVEKTGGCWLWKGATGPNGSGQLRWRGKTVYAHLVSLELAGRAPAKGTKTLWSCGNHACVSPEHLSQKSRREQAIERIGKTEGQKTEGEAPEGT